MDKIKNIFKKKNDKSNKLEINNNDLDKTILIKKKVVKEETVSQEIKNEDLDKTIIVKKKETVEKTEIKPLKDKKSLNNQIKYDKTLYGSRKLNLDNSKESKKSRKWIYLKESLLIALIFSIVNIVAYYLIDDIMIINITNLEIVNVLATLIISFIIIFLFSFIIDYIVTEINVKLINKKQHKEGDGYRNRWVIKRKGLENIKPKKRK